MFVDTNTLIDEIKHLGSIFVMELLVTLVVTLQHTLQVPLNLVAFALELLYKLPGVRLLLLLALVPIDALHTVSQLARQYPLVAVAVTAVALATTWLCWFMLAALLQTLWWLAWYGPLLWTLGRTVWIVLRRYVLTKHRQSVEQASQSFQASLQQHAQQAAQLLLRKALAVTSVSASVPEELPK